MIEWRVPGQDHGVVQHRIEFIQHFQQRRLVSEHIKADSMYAISVLVHEHAPRLYQLVEQHLAPGIDDGQFDDLGLSVAGGLSVQDDYITSLQQIGDRLAARGTAVSADTAAQS